MYNILQIKKFVNEAEFKVYLAMELKKIIPSVFVEYNILNLYLDNLNEYKNIGSKFVSGNNAPVIDIAIIYEKNTYPIELKYSLYNGNKESAGVDGKTALDGFMDDSKKIKNIININAGYCILLTNVKNFINKKINNECMVNEHEWIDIENPYGYSYLFMEIN
jgi:hypothetical protein